MQVFISRKKQNVGALIDFKNAFHLNVILVCSEKHTTMINEAIANNAKSNKHYDTLKRLYVHYVENGKVINVTSHI
jgi:hypothetical protein